MCYSQFFLTKLLTLSILFSTAVRAVVVAKLVILSTKHWSLRRGLENVLKTSPSGDVFNTSWSRPIYSSWTYAFKMSSRCFEDLFKTSSRCLEDVFKTLLKRFQDFLQRYIQDVFKTYLQVELVIGNTSSRSIARAVIYRRIFLVHNSEKVMVSVQNLQEREKFSSFSFLLYYTFAYYTF